jgi:hypothetical protein
MRILLWGLAAAVVCIFVLSGCDQIDVGGNPSAPGTPVGDYRNLYDRFLTSHRMMIQSLFAASVPNFPGAEEAAGRCSALLRQMQQMIEEPKRSEMEEYIVRYERAQANFKRNRAAGSRTRLELWDGHIMRDFSFSEVSIIGDATPEPTPPQPTPPPTPEPPDATPRWMVFTAWEKLHEQLESLWAAGEDCSRTYEKLLDTLARLGKGLTGAKAAKLATLVDSYRATHKATAGFTQVPENRSRKDVLNDLQVTESALRLHFE